MKQMDKESAANYWKNIDVDKLKPVPIGPPTRTEEELEEARKRYEQVEEHNRRVHEMNGLKYDDKQLFPK